jgi:hypothetical protein
MKYQILQGDNRETLKSLLDNSIDAWYAHTHPLQATGLFE